MNVSLRAEGAIEDRIRRGEKRGVVHRCLSGKPTSPVLKGYDAHIMMLLTLSSFLLPTTA